MGTSRPTATGSHHGARAARTAGALNGARAYFARDTKPRTAVASRHARRRDGDIAPYRQAARGRGRGEGNGGDIDRGYPRTPRVERREPGGWGAPRAVATRWGHRALPQRDRTTGQVLCAVEFRVRNAPWVMRVGNGGTIMTSRRVRGPAAHRAADRAAACKTLSACYVSNHAPWR